MRKSEFFFVCGRIGVDVFMTYVAMLAAYFVRMKHFELLGLSAPMTLFPLDSYHGFAFKIAAAIVLLLALNGRYRHEVDEKYWDEVLRVSVAYTFGFGILVVLFYFSQFYFFSRFIFGLAWVSGLVFVLLGRAGVRWIRRSFYRRGMGRKRILLLGDGKLAMEAIEILQKEERYDIVGILTQKKGGAATFQGLKVLGAFADMEKVLKSEEVDEVFLVCEHSTEIITAKLVRIAHIHHTRFRFLPDELGLDLALISVTSMGDYPLVTLLSTRLQGWGVVMKTVFDYVLALLLTIVTSPLMLFLALRVKMEYPKASVFYASKRVGKRGKEFYCLKFRSMVPDAEKKKPELLKKNERKGSVLFKMKNDPRVTKFGKFLRMWSLDELPQLFNVLRGDMSLIGPRPHLSEEVKRYPKDDLRLLSLKPGITGFAQINGRSGLSFEQEMKFESFYLKKWSLGLDIIIFLKTMDVLLRRKNAD